MMHLVTHIQGCVSKEKEIGSCGQPAHQACSRSGATTSGRELYLILMRADSAAAQQGARQCETWDAAGPYTWDQLLFSSDI